MHLKKEKIWSWIFLDIVVINLLCSLSSVAANNCITIYVHKVGGSTGLSGALVSIFAFAAILGRVMSGILSDKYGKRRILLFGAALLLIGVVLPIILPSLQLLFLFRIIQGLGFAFLTTAASAVAADNIPLSRMGEGIGYFGMGQSLAIAFGASFGVWLVFGGNYKFMFGGLSVISFVILILTYFCRDTKKEMIITANVEKNKGKNYKPSLIWQVFEYNAVTPSVIQIVSSFGFSIHIVFITLYAVQKGFLHPTGFFTCAAAAMIVSRLTAGWLIDKYNTLTILIPIQLMGVLSFVFVAFTDLPSLYYAAGFLYGLSVGIGMPLLNTAAIKRSNPARWGAANATYYLSGDIAIALGTIFWGLIISRYTFLGAFYGGITCMLVSIIIGVFTLKKDFGKETVAES